MKYFLGLFLGLILPVFAQAFLPGERLEYNIFWKGMHVGNSIMTIGKEEIEQKGIKCLVLKSFAKSSSLIRFLFQVDDKIVSYYDPEKKRTVAGSKEIHEGRFHKEYHVEFDHKRKMANWWAKQHRGGREEVSGDDTFKAKSGKSMDVPETVLDVLSAIYYFRENPTPPEFGAFFSMPVYDDLQMTSLDMKIVGEEILELEVNGQLSQYPAILVRPYLATSGIFQSDGEILIWVSNDFRRIPLRIQSSVKNMGQVTVDLFQTSGLAPEPIPVEVPSKKETEKKAP